MNKRKIVLRLLACPFVLGLLLITYVYGALKRWIQFLKHGGEFLLYEKDESVAIKMIYEEIKKEKSINR